MRLNRLSIFTAVFLVFALPAMAQNPPPPPPPAPTVSPTGKSAMPIVTEGTSAQPTTAPTAPPPGPPVMQVKKPGTAKTETEPVVAPTAPTAPVEPTAAQVNESVTSPLVSLKKPKETRRLKRLIAVFQIEVDGKPLGTFKAQLFPDKAPKTVENFTELVEGKKQFKEYDASKGKINSLVARPFYDGLTFHRIVADYVIQGGCPFGNGRGGTGEYINDEITKELRHTAGTLAMASAGRKDSNSSQFYVTLKELKHLDGKYTIFGKVIEGMDVINKIAQIKSDRMTQMPLEKAVMKTVSIVREYAN